MGAENWIAAFSATAAAVAAIAAWRAVRSSIRSTEAQILLHLRTEFSSQPMHDALRLLSTFKKERGNQFVEAFQKLKDQNSEEFHRLNNARRLIKGYYLKVYHLNRAKILRGNAIHAVISKDSFDLMLGVLEPLEKVIAVSQHDEFLFKWAGELRSH